MRSLDRKDRLLVIAPHPDDEVIGCGGLMQKVKSTGGKVYVQFLALGDTNDFSKKGKSTGSERLREIEKAAKFLKYDKFHIAFSGPEFQLKLDKLGQLAIMNMIERESPISIERVKPTIVAFPSVDSYNQDHAIAAKATHASLRNSSGEKHFVRTVISYEQAADFWTLENMPPANLLLPMNEKEFKTKIKALKLYKSQWRKFPSSRSEEVLRSLAVIRGSQANARFAEGYNYYRSIVL